MPPIADGFSVIHAGVLMPATQAWAQMMQEFPQHGYTEEHIRSILERATESTQNLLKEISGLPETEAAIRLEWALRADLQAAQRWRAQWSTARVVEEEHAARMARYQRDKELQEKMRQETPEQQQRREEKERKEEERKERYRQEQAVECRKKAAFEEWQRKNESGGRDAWVEERVRQRKQEDQEIYDRILARAAPITSSSLGVWISTNPPLKEGGTFNAMLSLFSDHQYIEWMFDCAKLGLMAPV